MARDRVPLHRWILFGSIALGGAAFDLTTKSLIFARLGAPGSSPPHVLIPNVLDLRTSTNTGALWGFLRNFSFSSAFLAGLSIVAGFVICWWLFVRGAAKDKWFTVAMGLIMAGAMGNCFDRLWFGYVRDFVYFHVDSIRFECAIFNFADNMLVIGAVMIMLLALRPESASKDEADVLQAEAAS